MTMRGARLPPQVTPTYEELKLWTPAFAGSTTAGVFTYVAQTGHYTRMGNVCFILGMIQISAISTPPVGDMRITGLPITAATLTNVNPHIGFSFISQVNLTAGTIDVSGLINPTDTIIRIMEAFDNAAGDDMPASNFTNAAARMHFSGFYFV